MTTPPLARDLDLVREILGWIENGSPRDRIPNNGDERYRYHCKLMKDAGLIEAQMRSTDGPVPDRVEVEDMTWNGHEVLAAMRNETVWARAKAKAAEIGLPMLLGLLVSIAKRVAADQGYSIE